MEPIPFDQLVDHLKTELSNHLRGELIDFNSRGTPKIALNKEEAAEALGISVSSLQRLEVRGKIKRLPDMGRAVYSVEALKKLCKQF